MTTLLVVIAIYGALSSLATLLIYGCCVAAARADRVAAGRRGGATAPGAPQPPVATIETPTGTVTLQTPVAPATATPQPSPTEFELMRKVGVK